jgi:hypothetical protein
MDTVERLTAAFRREPVDRVPVVAWLGLPLIRRMTPSSLTMLDLFDLWVEDPVSSIVKLQENLGLDPILCTHSFFLGTVQRWGEKCMPWPADALENWRVVEEPLRAESSRRYFRRTIATPAGQFTYTFCIENHSCWQLDYLLKKPDDIQLVQYQPDPARADLSRLRSMIDKVGHRAFFTHSVSGIWHEAAKLRNITTLMLDVHDRPEWVRSLLEQIARYKVREMQALATIGVHSVLYNETSLGVGMSPTMYREFILPLDRQVVRAARQAGLLVSYHNCGRSTKILELMADTGTDALETLTPPGLSGDTNLADAKHRVGARVCLFGGFSERVLVEDDPSKVQDEVKRCIDAAADGGGYILRTAGQVLDARPGSIDAMVKTACEYGRY